MPENNPLGYLPPEQQMQMLGGAGPAMSGAALTGGIGNAVLQMLQGGMPEFSPSQVQPTEQVVQQRRNPMDTNNYAWDKFSNEQLWQASGMGDSGMSMAARAEMKRRGVTSKELSQQYSGQPRR